MLALRGTGMSELKPSDRKDGVSATTAEQPVAGGGSESAASTSTQPSQDRLELGVSVLQGMAGGVQVIDRQWRYVYLNAEVISQSGYQSASDLIGFTMMEKYPGIENTKLFHILQKSMTQRIDQRIENHFIYPNGSEGWFDISIHAISAGLLLLSYDITARRQAEVRLRAITEFYEVLATNSNDGVAVLGADGQPRYVSPAYARMMGYAPEELQHWKLRDMLAMIHPDDRRRVVAALRRSRALALPKSRYEYRARRKDGSYFWVEDFLSCESDERGKLVRVIANARDISERKRAEEAQRLDSEIMAHMGDGVYLARCRDRVIVHTNPQLLRMFGYDPHELIGRPVTPLNPLSHQELNDIANEIISSISQAKKWSGETQHTRKDGTTFWSLTNISIFEHSEHGRVWICVHRDITDRKRSEALHRAQEQENQENQRLKSLGLLAGGVAHDINNLLTPISAGIDLLCQRYPKSGIERSMLESVATASHKIRDIVRQMLAYAGRSTPAFTAVDLNALVRELYALLFASLPTDVSVQLTLTGAALPLQADSTQLQQVLMNLIINAAESFEGRRGQVYVTTERRRADHPGECDQGVLSVRDTGPGIQPDHLRRIFDPFFTTKRTGRGLGLSATQGIVRAHHGELEVHSVYGSGTTFTVRLPLCPKPPPPATTQPAPPTPRALSGLWLLIDDEPLVRTSTSLVLQSLGGRTLEACDGAEGLALAEEHSDKLAGVLLDLTMPDMGGREVFARLRARHPRLPIVLFSGHSEQKVEDLLDLPRVRFVAKPFTPKALLQTLLAIASQDGL